MMEQCNQIDDDGMSLNSLISVKNDLFSVFDQPKLFQISLKFK